MIRSVGPKICTKMPRNLSGKLVAKFPSTTFGYSMVRIALVNDAFLRRFEPDASPVEGQSLQQKDKKKKEKGKVKKI